MAVINTNNYIDYYRELAKARSDISGRGGNLEDLRICAEQLIEKLSLSPGDRVVDIGCGDGAALIMALEKVKEQDGWLLIGILPTEEEVDFVKISRRVNAADITLQVGLATATGISDAVANVVICNGVLLLLQNNDEIEKAICEISRVSKPGGRILIGELPERDEKEIPVPLFHNESFFWRGCNVIKNEGVFGIVRRLRTRFFSSAACIVKPNQTLWFPKDEFIKKLERLGLEVIECYRPIGFDPLKKSHTMSASRWSYLCRKPIQFVSDER